jgi:hypothetical protein
VKSGFRMQSYTGSSHLFFPETNGAEFSHAQKKRPVPKSRDGAFYIFIARISETSWKEVPVHTPDVYPTVLTEKPEKWR